ncbi:MAG: hypothetical protein R3C19_18680 [Planctomycetaceae bacterium]
MKTPQLLFLLTAVVFPSITAGPVRADESLSNRNGSEHVEVENLVRLSDRVYSGGEPKTAEAFAALKRMGVRTIVSVDGVRPKVELAKRHGLRYVHIPFGYDGIPSGATNALTAVIRETSGPVFIHCHHGKHRGPAAAAIACRVEGSADAARALQILTDAGTSKEYAGLWRDVAAFVPPLPDTKLPELVEVADVEALAEAMARLSRSFDHLKRFRSMDWAKADAETAPEITASREALLLSEILHETSRTLPADSDAEFVRLLTESDELASTLLIDVREEKVDAANQAFDRLSDCCHRCHVRFRD